MSSPDDTTRPLLGLRVLLTGLRSTNERAAARLIDLGALPVELPLQELQIIPEALRLLPRTDFTLFTSAAAARLYGSRLLALNGVGRIACVGPATAEALADYALSPEIMPEADYSAQGLLASIVQAGLDLPRLSFLLPCSALADKILEEGLRGLGATVVRHEFYRPAPLAVAGCPACDAVLFFSPSAVEAYCSLPGLPKLCSLRVAVIGSATAQVLRSLRPDLDFAVAAEATAAATAQALCTCGIRHA